MSRIVLAAALGAALLAGGTTWAGEEPVRERVEALMPRLQSEDDAVRERAENEIFALGERGRLEMERLSRDADTRKALTALRLLQSDRWAAGPLRDGERPLRRADAEDGPRVHELEAEMERRFREMQRRIEEALRDVPRLRMPEWEWPGLDLDDEAPSGSVTLQGTVVRDGRTLTWRRAADGSVRVTVQDGEGEELVLEADSIDAFREAHPDVAAELDDVVPSWTGAPTVRLLDRVPDLRLPPRVWRWWNDDGEDAPAARTGPGEPETAGGPVLGIRWGAVSPLLRHHLRLGDTGVVVESVIAGSTAARLGMQPLDVLVELAGRPIRTRDDIPAALRAAGDARIDAVVIRRGERTTLRGAD